MRAQLAGFGQLAGRSAGKWHVHVRVCARRGVCAGGCVPSTRNI